MTKIDPRNPADAALIAEAKAALKSMPKPAKGLGRDESKVSILTLADGTTAELWGHANWGQATNFMRREGRNGETAIVEHVVKNGAGRGEITRRCGRYSVTCGAPSGAWAKLDA